MHRQFSLVLGRFQISQPHKGHFALIDNLLRDGKNVLIALRKEDGSGKNPFTQAQRKAAFEGFYREKIAEGRIVIMGVPDVTEVVYGRTPGWDIREIDVGQAGTGVSGTEIRKSGGHKVYWLTGNSGSGKTTIANLLLGPLNAINLDGDQMRASISLGAGFSIEERLKHNLRVARLAKELVRQRNVVVSVIAPMESIRDAIEKEMAPIQPYWIWIFRDQRPRKDYPFESPTGRARCMTIINEPSMWTTEQVAARILTQIKGI